MSGINMKSQANANYQYQSTGITQSEYYTGENAEKLVT